MEREREEKSGGREREGEGKKILEWERIDGRRRRD